MIIDLKAAQKWNSIPKDIQKLFLDNVFCSACGLTSIVEYSMHDEKFGILLKGQCKKCGKAVARVIEEE